jgi:hypothetical protein
MLRTPAPVDVAKGSERGPHVQPAAFGDDREHCLGPIGLVVVEVEHRRDARPLQEVADIHAELSQVRANGGGVTVFKRMSVLTPVGVPWRVGTKIGSEAAPYTPDTAAETPCRRMCPLESSASTLK